MKGIYVVTHPLAFFFFFEKENLLQLVLSPFTHPWHSVIDTVIVCPYHTHTLHTSLTPWFDGYRRHTPSTKNELEAWRKHRRMMWKLHDLM